MNIHLEKCMRILSDLVAYCHYQGATEYKMYLNHKDGIAHVTISALTKELEDDKLQALIQELNLPRQREIEQNYWELSGETDTNQDLALIGMMIDYAEVEYKDGALHIALWRHD